MSFQFVRDCLRWSPPWVHIAKTLIAGEYVTQMVARLERGVLAVPVHSAGADVYHRTPGSIARSLAGRSPERRPRCKSSEAKHQFQRAFRHDESLLPHAIASYIKDYRNRCC